MNQPVDTTTVDGPWTVGPLAQPDGSAAGAVRVLLEHRDEIARDWAELCAWDPDLPPDATSVGPDYLLTAIAAALARPQPLGWGLDPALVQASRDIAREVSVPEDTATQLLCLGDALDRHITAHVPAADRLEVLRRLHMIISRLITHTVRESTHHLRTLAFNDPLTGLPNRRAFDDDLAREVSRARRHRHPLSLAITDIDGLKQVNDRDGHAAGDELLRRVAGLLRTALRREDVAYRIGGDEFALLLPAIDIRDGAFLHARLRGEVPLSIGVASSTRDPIDQLFELADARLYEGRRRTRGR